MIRSELYRDAAAQLLQETGCTLVKTRATMSGCAYTKSDDWGIEAPEVKGPVSFAVLAHEVGHQMLHRRGGNRRSHSRWQKEVEAWNYTFDQFDRFGLPAEGVALSMAAPRVRDAFYRALRRSNRRPALAEEMRQVSGRWYYCVQIAERTIALHERQERIAAATGVTSAVLG